jgi:hypothetical protein
MRFLIHSICSSLLSLSFISHTHSFDDDSRDDTRSALINSFCENKQVLNDTPSLKSSCQGDIVNLQIQNSTLVKNVKPISRSPVLDFKVSRNVKVYYRTRNGRFLYNESGRLKSLGGAMIIYLVSSNEDAIYLNNQGIVFKNGEPLNQNQVKVNFLI